MKILPRLGAQQRTALGSARGVGPRRLHVQDGTDRRRTPPKSTSRSKRGSDVHIRDAVPTARFGPLHAHGRCDRRAARYCGDVGDAALASVHCRLHRARHLRGTGTPGLCGPPGLHASRDRVHGGRCRHHCGTVVTAAAIRVSCGDTCTAPGSSAAAPASPMSAGDPNCVPRTALDVRVGGAVLRRHRRTAATQPRCGDCPAGSTATRQAPVHRPRAAHRRSPAVRDRLLPTVASSATDAMAMDCGTSCRPARPAAANVPGIAESPLHAHGVHLPSAASTAEAIGDGCDRALDCGACPAGTFCDPTKHICLPPAARRP